MKPIVLKSILIFVVLYFLSSCHKDTVTPVDNPISDYLPMNVGAKYLYSYSGHYYYPGDYAAHWEEGECQWEFIERNPTPPYVYKVRQILNGIHVTKREYTTSFKIDTTVISNRIDELTFKENNDGIVTITFPVMYWKGGSETVKRYFESSKTDTCTGSLSPRWRICLTKNVGIKTLGYSVIANHSASTKYTLVKGPY